MHNAPFIPLITSATTTTATAATTATATATSTTSYYTNSTHSTHSTHSTNSITKDGLKRPPSAESLTSIGNKTKHISTGTDTHTGIRPGTSTRTRPTIISTTISAKTATITTTASFSPSSRTPLRLRDQNVAPVTEVLLKEPGIGNMPPDTTSPPSTNAQGNNSRSQMPSLSAAAARAINRNPLTPKIASKTAHQPPAITTTTTSASRRPQHPTLANANSSYRSSYLDESTSSSFASHLNANIASRSGSRQTRAESAHTTPSGTPNVERSEVWEPRSNFALPSPRLEGETMRRSAASFSSISPDMGGHGKDTLDSKFFHASDMKSSRPASASRTPQAKSPTFLHANGNTKESKSSHPTLYSPAPVQSQETLSSKFMYANGTPEPRHAPTPPVSRSSGSTPSTGLKASGNRPATNPSLTQRPMSPAILPSLASQTSSKPNIGPGAGRPQVLSSQQLGPSPPVLRRSSTGTSRAGGHSRAGSLAKGEHIVPKLANSRASPEPFVPPNVPSTPAPPPLTLASIIQAAEDLADNDGSASPDEALSGLQSPTKSVHSIEPANELVANARRERKVQDLQITNASLEAINRTLERQLRKQTTELRRYRRLSRSSRLSAASTALSSEAPAEEFSNEGIAATALSDLSEEEPDIEEEDSLFEDDMASGSVSPSVGGERDTKHRKRDEERLQLDLSNHQQLLIDSQKINQSIKRCLDWTEVLISEGKKALEYHVRVSDVEVGGRVLDPLDDDDERPSTAGSFPDDTITLDEKLLDHPPGLVSWGFEPQDRDSGIELTVVGS